MPDRQLRLLVALATWLPDDTTAVSVGLGTLMKTAGSARNTIRRARRELEGSGRLSSEPGGRGRGNVTRWTVHCLPAKGVSVIDPLAGDAGKPARCPSRARRRRPGERPAPRIRDVVVPGSIRVKRTVWETTVMTVVCGQCGRDLEVSAGGHTATCKCGRTCRLDSAPAAANVTPIRRAAR
jgi:hypothetical protein